MLGIARHAGSSAWAGGAPAALFTPQLTADIQQWRNFKSQIINGSFRYQNFTGSELPFSGNSGKFAASYCRFIPEGYYSSLENYWSLDQPVWEGGPFEYQVFEPGTNNYGYIRAGGNFYCPNYQVNNTTTWYMSTATNNAISNTYRDQPNGIAFTPAEVEGVWTTWQISASVDRADFAGFFDPLQGTAPDNQCIFYRFRMVNSIVGERVLDSVINLFNPANKTSWVNAGAFGFSSISANGWSGQLYTIGDMQYFTQGNTTNSWQLLGQAVDWKAQGYRLCDSRGLPKFIGTDTIPSSGGDVTATTYASIRTWPTYTHVYDPDPNNNIYNYRATFPPDYTSMTGNAAVIAMDYYNIVWADVPATFNGANPYGV